MTLCVSQHVYQMSSTRQKIKYVLLAECLIEFYSSTLC